MNQNNTVQPINVLEVQDLVKTYSRGPIENTVLAGISFEVKAGEFVAIMGQSGSGKSTLLYNISGMDQMTSGHVRIGGNDLSQKSLDDLAHFRLHTMGFIFQQNYLLKNLNLLDNICLPALKAGASHRRGAAARPELFGNKPHHAQVKAKALALMKKLDIEDLAHHGIHQVSGGQLQRAAICRALINNPQIIFADEPTGALNSSAAGEVLNILNQVNQEATTILTVTHDPKVASVTDRIIYLKDGQIEAELHLGKFLDPKHGLDSEASANTRRKREETTLNWLIERGF